MVVEEYDRWVEPLDALLRNTLVQDLGALVPSAQVLGDAVPGLSADRTVVVAVNRLDMSSQLVMDAVWFVLPAGKDQPERTQRTRLDRERRLGPAGRHRPGPRKGDGAAVTGDGRRADRAAPGAARTPG